MVQIFYANKLPYLVDISTADFANELVLQFVFKGRYTNWDYTDEISLL
jgi:hypothetical protein